MARADKDDPLAKYNSKRDFSKTASRRERTTSSPGAAGNGFMVQKHDATRLHWDLRLELDGTLKSWAVPRGPSLDPQGEPARGRTEDHPLSYATFEGRSPRANMAADRDDVGSRHLGQPPGKDPRKGWRRGTSTSLSRASG
jgi:bifunctional non-homologous end joining protein LigD